MPSKSETGHAINVANFNDLISFVQGYGASYNPSNAAIGIPALETLLASGNTALAAVNAAIPAYNTTVAAREVAFAPLSKLITRVMNFLKASGVSSQVYDNARTIARKIQGVRASAKPAATAPAEENGEATEVKTVSSSQMSFNSRVENLGKLVQLLSAIPEYNPNEPELTTAALTTLHSELNTRNTAVITAEVPLSNARIARNEVLYTDTTGLVDIALTVKNYIKAVFGATSPQYKQISKLKFTRAK